MRPKHWQLPQCEWYPNGERKYSGVFYEDCPDSNPDYNDDAEGLVDEIDLPDDPFGP